MPAQIRRFSALLLLTVPLAPLAWAGCEAARDSGVPYVPSNDGAVTGDASTNPAVVTGPITPSRKIVHVPRGETRTFQVTVDPNGALGLAQLTATVTSPDLTIQTAQEGENHFVVTATAKADAKAVDTEIILHVVTDRGADVGTREVRVLVGLPGTSDVSFGDKGAVTVEAPVASPGMFALVGGTALIASENHDVWEVSNEGVARPLLALDLAGDCTVKAIAADHVAILVSGYCGTDTPFLAEALRTIAEDAGAVPTVAITTASIHAIARSSDAGFYLAQSAVASDLIAFRQATAPTPLPLAFPQQLVPGAGGFFIVSNDGLQSSLVHAKGSPPAVVTAFGDGGVTSVDIAAGDDTDPFVAAAFSTSGKIVVATSVDATIQADDRVFLHSFTTTGEVAGLAAIDGATYGAVAADARDRIIVAAETSGTTRIHRFHSDAGADDTIGTQASMPSCSPAMVGVDDEGMIVVLCGGATGSVLHRFWP